jgi:putative tryptophan/tyrosine transport system substrate-binding protein
MWKMFFFLCSMAGVTSVAMGIGALAEEVGAVPNFMSADYGWLPNNVPPNNPAGLYLTTTIPVISSFASDPVRNGFVANLSRPGGNFTGDYRFGSELEPKRLELLCEATPNVTVVDMLVNPDGAITDASSRDVEAAARRLGRQIRTHTARNDTEIDTVFTTLSKLRAGALLIMGDSFFASRSRQLGELAARHAIPRFP